MSNSPAPTIPANASTFTADVGSVSVYRDGGHVCLVSVEGTTAPPYGIRF